MISTKPNTLSFAAFASSRELIPRRSPERLTRRREEREDELFQNSPPTFMINRTYSVRQRRERPLKRRRKTWGTPSPGVWPCSTSVHTGREGAAASTFPCNCHGKTPPHLRLNGGSGLPHIRSHHIQETGRHRILETTGPAGEEKSRTRKTRFPGRGN